MYMQGGFLESFGENFSSHSRNIQSINKNGGQQAQSHSLPRGGNGKVYGIAAVSSCPDGKSSNKYSL